MRILTGVLILVAGACAQPVRPPEAAPNLPAQAIGRDDLIAVSVYGSPELSRTVRVDTDGFIRLPMVQQNIKAEGLHPGELEARIAAALRQEQILVEPFVTVIIAEYHSRPVSVMGAVKMPLVFQAEAPTTLLEALARAQGLRDDAGPEILVSQSETGPDGQPRPLVRRINIRELIDAANPALNVKLTGGEEIRVPEASKIFVVGNVKKPGAFPVPDSNGTTVLKLLAVAEGLLPYAANDAYIFRRNASGATDEIPVQLTKILQRKAADVTLTANDILYVPDSKGRRLGFAAIEKILLFGSTAGATALIYAR
jgi:polysaccharide export outer membrane protein